VRGRSGVSLALLGGLLTSGLFASLPGAGATGTGAVPPPVGRLPVLGDGGAERHDLVASVRPSFRAR